MHLLRVPLLNANEDEVEVVEVRAREGTSIATGDIICVLETSKASLDVESPAVGFIRRLSIAARQRVPVGAVICAITATADEPVDLPSEAPASTAVAGSERATRKARELAAAHGLDLAEIGSSEIIKEEDVRKLLSARAKLAPARKCQPLKPPKGKQPVVIYGASGHAKVLIDLIRSSYKDLFIIAAVDDSAEASVEVLGIPVIGASAELARLRKQQSRLAVLGIGSVTHHQHRRSLYEKLISLGFNVPNLIHHRALLEPSVTMGEGNQVFAGAVVGSAARLGTNTIINSGVVVSHDCLIGSHTHLAPGCILAGGVTVGEDTLVGMGVTVYLGVRIGSRVTIANGVHVMKDVPDGAVLRATEK